MKYILKFPKVQMHHIGMKQFGVEIKKSEYSNIYNLIYKIEDLLMFYFVFI